MLKAVCVRACACVCVRAHAHVRACVCSVKHGCKGTWVRERTLTYPLLADSALRVVWRAALSLCPRSSKKASKKTRGSFPKLRRSTSTSTHARMRTRHECTLTYARARTRTRTRTRTHTSVHIHTHPPTRSWRAHTQVPRSLHEHSPQTAEALLKGVLPTLPVCRRGDALGNGTVNLHRNSLNKPKLFLRSPIHGANLHTHGRAKPRVHTTLVVLGTAAVQV